MALHIGWRSFWWLNTGLIAVSLIMVICKTIEMPVLVY